MFDRPKTQKYDIIALVFHRPDVLKPLSVTNTNKLLSKENRTLP